MGRVDRDPVLQVQDVVDDEGAVLPPKGIDEFLVFLIEGLSFPVPPQLDGAEDVLAALDRRDEDARQGGLDLLDVSLAHRGIDFQERVRGVLCAGFPDVLHQDALAGAHDLSGESTVGIEEVEIHLLPKPRFVRL